MAKSKQQNDEDSVTFMGQSVDPDIQKKVDEYMELESSEEKSEPTLPNQETAETNDVPVSSEPASTAPLLPTEELPVVVKEPKANKIEIKHFDELDEEKAEPAEEPEEATEEAIEPKTDTAIAEEGADETEEEEPPTDEKIEASPEAVDETAAEPESEEEPAEELEEEKHLDSELIDLTKDPDLIAAPGFEEGEIDRTKTLAELAESTKPSTEEDPELANAIDEIVAEDADKLLKVEDEQKAEAPLVAPVQKKPKQPKGNPLKKLVKNPIFIKSSIALFIIGIGAAAVLPSSRYLALNTAGVRVSASMKVLDDKTGLPLKNVEMVINNQSSKSDSEGFVKVDKVKLGKQQIIIKKLAFAEVKRDFTLGWGSNPLGEQRLVPTGTQFTIAAKDYVSERPLTTAEVNFGESSAKFNDKGEALLTIPNVEEDEIEVSVSAKDYREEKIKINVESKDVINVSMVPSKKHVFVSKRSGKFDLYKSDIDAKNEEVILAATGIEKEETLSLSSHPKKEVVAFSSSRENVRNQDGFLLNTLNIIYLDTKEVVKVAQSERIQIIDWAGDRLIYVKITEGASQANPNRHKIMSYDVETNSEVELASTNYFNDIVAVNGVIYYSPALYQINGKVGLYRVNADGTNRKNIYEKEVWNIFRTAYDKFSFSVSQDWYELNLGSDEVKRVGGAPSVLKSRVYINSPDGKQSIWVDERDGKSVLLSYAIDQKTDKTLITENGVKNPIYWLDSNHLVYRIADGTETADYVISLSGGIPKKIQDVTNTVGVDRWYYF